MYCIVFHVDCYQDNLTTRISREYVVDDAIITDARIKQLKEHSVANPPPQISLSALLHGIFKL
jgi:hypothetical protein